jgi:hypothetical protein
MSTNHNQQWALVCVRENLCPRTVERFRRGMPVRRSSLARIARAVEALGLQHLLREQADTTASA